MAGTANAGASIVPIRPNAIAPASKAIAKMLLVQAEDLLREEVPDLDQKYTKEEQDAMICEKALVLHSLMSMSLDAAGAEILEYLKQTGPYHPDVRGDVQEIIDELLSISHQNILYQTRFIVNEVIPKAEEYGINVREWLSKTTKWKLVKVAPLFRFLLDEMECSEEERQAHFKNIVVVSTKTVTEITQALMQKGPQPFAVEEYETEEGYCWFIRVMTRDTRDWALRRLQPYARRYEDAD